MKDLVNLNNEAVKLDRDSSNFGLVNFSFFRFLGYPPATGSLLPP